MESPEEGLRMSAQGFGSKNLSRWWQNLREKRALRGVHSMGEKLCVGKIEHSWEGEEKLQARR